MAKRIEIDGKFYRVRRGKLVQIPDQWVGRITTDQTIRKRQSKEPRKFRMRGWHPKPGNPRNRSPRHIQGYSKKLDPENVLQEIIPCDILEPSLVYELPCLEPLRQDLREELRSIMKYEEQADGNPGDPADA